MLTHSRHSIVPSLIYSCNPSFTFIHSFVHRLIHSVIYLIIDSLTQSLTHSSTHPSIKPSLIHLFIHPSIHLFNLLLNYWLTYCPIHLLIPSFTLIHPLTHFFIHSSAQAYTLVFTCSIMHSVLCLITQVLACSSSCSLTLSFLLCLPTRLSRHLPASVFSHFSGEPRVPWKCTELPRQLPRLLGSFRVPNSLVFHLITKFSNLQDSANITDLEMVWAFDLLVKTKSHKD